MFSIPHSSIYTSSFLYPMIGQLSQFTCLTPTSIIIWLHRAQSLTNMLSMWNPQQWFLLTFCNFDTRNGISGSDRVVGRLRHLENIAYRPSPLSFRSFSLICYFTAHSLLLLPYTDQEPGTSYSSLFNLFFIIQKNMRLLIKQKLAWML